MNTAKKSNVTSIKKSARKSSKKRVVAAAKKAVQTTRQFLDQTMKIVKKVDGNPRREGTFGYKSFKLIKTGMTVEQFVQKGGRLRDLHWDLEHEYVELKKRA